MFLNFGHLSASKFFVNEQHICCISYHPVEMFLNLLDILWLGQVIRFLSLVV